MTHLIIAPKKVFRNIYYHVSQPIIPTETSRLTSIIETYGMNTWGIPMTTKVLTHFQETKNSYHRADPAFTYLLSLFLFLTGLAWGLAYADGFGKTLKIAFVFVFVQFLGSSLLLSTMMFFLVGRVLGKRKEGLFGPPVGGEEGLEFGYCFDVRIIPRSSSWALD
jgi:hypothetical protein